MKLQKVLSLGLATALLVSGVAMGNPSQTEAAKNPKLSATKITLKAGKSKTLTLKNTKKVKKVSWKNSSRKVLKFTKKSKFKYSIKGLKAGSAKITCTVTVKGAKKAKKLVCNVKVQNTTAPATESQMPAAAATETPAPTAKPVVTSLKEAYQPIFSEMGNCVNLYQLQDPELLAFVKKHYSSITLENEMKPDAILHNSTPTYVSVKEAKGMGYEISAEYEKNDSLVPVLDFSKIDEVLSICAANGLKMRAHTLVWHSQTPEWFFKKDYSDAGEYVSKEQMNARMEFYITNVMGHVYSAEGGKYKNVVYSWDVVNEYQHNNPGRNWSAVYGNRSELGNRPAYAKLAFQLAYKQLEKFNLVGKVKLFSNDFNTYKEDEGNPKNEIELINFINEGEKNKICDGIGMQSHLDIDYPTPAQYCAAIKEFAKNDFEIQITEFDATINNQEGIYKAEGQKNANQGVYVGELMKAIIAERKAGAKISCFTIWGLYDEVSWRKESRPTLFWKSITDPKASYKSFMEAANDWN